MTRRSGLMKNNKYVSFLHLITRGRTLTLVKLLIQEQDRTMDSISGTLNTLAQQAGLGRSSGAELGKAIKLADHVQLKR